MKTRKATDQRCTSSRRVTAGMLLSFLALAPSVTAANLPAAIDPWYPLPQPKQPHTDDFTLRHIFHRGTYRDPTLHKRYDFRPQASVLVTQDHGDAVSQSLEPPPHFILHSHSDQIERLADREPASIESYLQHARLSGGPAVLDASLWTLDEVKGPNISDKDTVINLAIMAANAYNPAPGLGEWENVTQGYNRSTPFGWEGDGLRGHIFANEGNETVIISLKGTSPAVFDGDGTTTKDKLNDNLFFSCCCGQGGSYFWHQVCDCQTSTYTCNSTCVVKALRHENRYYRAAIDLYTNVTELYPDSNVWLAGHSLGGSVTALLGLTFGLPTVTFEAPGEDLASKRLGLPAPPSSDPHKPRTKYTGAYHFGNTADPVFMGTCNGATATCTLGGYAMESQCHTGKQCIYDTVSDYGWRVGIGNHKIHNVIDNVIKMYKTVPACEPDDECVDCYNWKFFDSNGSDSTTSTRTTTTSLSTYTRTTTCKTPGWWGCLDETSTTSSTTPVITTTYTTTSCVTPGWFGCKETVNVTVTTTTADQTLKPPTTSVPASATHGPSSASSTYTSCEHPGWFGCRDPFLTSTTGHSAHPAPTSSSPSVSSTANPHKKHTCQTPGFFWGCQDERHDRTSTNSPTITGSPTASASSASTNQPSTTSHGKKRRKCKNPVFFGFFCLDGYEDEFVPEL
ncbi:putative lipase atg15 [Cladophialophora chaetospira]|uniref:Putative lipase ATG15 n=1 Tax=Cladophialophora chaetospira TaxID=386627 RepID=A0AA39CFQ4_9EURO|nr:putative lipase atg15 [Cladophialophora chaetospira]